MTNAEINYNAGASHRLEVHKEINSNKLNIDRSVFKKDDAEKATVKKHQLDFKNSGRLKAWNERNRPGNNKKVIQAQPQTILKDTKFKYKGDEKRVGQSPIAKHPGIAALAISLERGKGLVK